VKLSIIIVNYRAWGHIEKALRVIEPDFPDDWEIIVVDNETNPRTCAEFQQRFGWVKIIPNPTNSGFGQGCIIGVAAASGEQLLFMNPDVLASVADIRALIREKQRDPEVAIIAPKQLDDDGRPQKVFDEFPDVLNQSKVLKLLRRKLSPGRSPDPRKDYDDRVDCDWVTGSFLLIDLDDYNRTGGWSNDYWMYVEDADLCKRAHDAGLRVAYTPKVAVVHSHGGSSRINVAVKTLTKLEVIISKHVYVHNHFVPGRRLAGHLMIALSRLPGLLLASLLDVLTFGRVATLSIRRHMLAGLLRYYAGVRRTGLWYSARALDNKAAQS
jgi:hypothetical protein